MTSAATAPTPGTRWGRLDEPTHDLWATEPAEKELEPYRVRYGGDVYSQAEFLQRDARYYNFTSGIGAGKTVAGILRVAANVERWNPGETGMIVAPTVPALKNVIMPELRKWGFLASWEYRGPGTDAPGIHAPNGARILLESANNERKIQRLRGPSLAWFWIDEAAQIPHRAWQVLVGRLRSGQYRNGFITTTPRGFNWVHETFVDPETRLDDVANVLGVPTHANPHTPDDYTAAVERDYSGQFYEQEVLGRFVKFEGLVYPWFTNAPSPEGHVVDADPVNPARTIYGLDWGHRNPAAIVAIVVTPNGEWYILEEFKQSRCTVADLARVLGDMADRRAPGPIYCDPAEPASIETLQRAGLDARSAPNDVQAGIRAVARRKDQWRVHARCQEVINEFGMYRYRDDDSEDPLKQNDHLCDAVRYATLGNEQGGSASVGVVSGKRTDDLAGGGGSDGVL